MEARTVKLQVRETQDQDGVGRFIGHASVFGVLDEYGTIFDKGCFKRTINRRNPFALTWVHDVRALLGMSDLEEDEKGLLVEGKLNLETQLGRETYSGMRMGYIDSMSHGFERVQTRTGQDDVLHFTEVKLFEVALCPRHIGANPEAKVAAVRAAQGHLTRLRELQAEGATAELLRVAQEVREILDGMEIRGPTSFQDLPLASRERAWDAAAATQRVRRWAGAEDEPNAQYRKAFLWYDASEPDQFGSYKLPYADVIDGTLHCVPRAIFAAAARIDQTDISDADKDAVKRHMERYYAKMRREFDDEDLVAPWKRSFGSYMLPYADVIDGTLHIEDVDGGVESALLTELRALREAIGSLTSPRSSHDSPTMGSDSQDLHSLLDNLRAYRQTLARR